MGLVSLVLSPRALPHSPAASGLTLLWAGRCLVLMCWRPGMGVGEEGQQTRERERN